MVSTRIILPVAAFLSALAIAILAVTLPFIPTWFSFQVVTAILAVAGALASGIWLVRGTWVQTLYKMKSEFRIVLVLATGFVASCALLFVAMAAAFMLSGGLFSPVYHHAVQFPEYETTIYVYDDGFLDPSTLVTYRRGWLPFMNRIGSYPDMYAEDLEITQQGEWAVHERFGLHLPTGNVTQH